MCKVELKHFLNLNENDILIVQSFNSISNFKVYIRTNLNKTDSDLDNNNQCNNLIRRFI